MEPHSNRVSPSRLISVCVVSALDPLESAIPLYTKEMVKGYLRSGLPLALTLIVNRSAAKLKAPGLEVQPIWQRGVTYPFHIFKAILRIRPDIVHIQHEMFLYGGALSAAIFPMLLMMCRLDWTPTVVTIHGVPSPRMINAEFREGYILSRYTAFMVIPLILLVKVIGILSSRVIVHTKFMSNVLTDDFQIPPQKIAVIPHGTPLLEIREVCNGGNQKKRPFTFLFFGWLTPGKGIEILLEAFAAIPGEDTELLIAGGTHPRDKLYAANIATRANSDSRVKVLGYISDDEIPSLFKCADVVVLPYLLQVGGGSAALAMSFGHGKPVVASNLEFFQELIKDRINGLLIPPGSVEGFRQALSSLKENSLLLATLTHNAKISGKLLGWDVIASTTFTRCYQPLLNHGRR